MDEKGLLTQEERDKAWAWLQAKGLKPCPMCPNGRWIVAQHLMTMTPYSETRASLPISGGVTYPVFLLACLNCGHMSAHSAVLAGLAKPGTKQDQQNEPEEGK